MAQSQINKGTSKMDNNVRDYNEIVKDIEKVLEKIRPYLNSEGGDIEMLKFEEGIVYVKMMGACVDCGALDSTLTDGVEALLMEYVPEVIGVKNVVDEL